LPLKTIEQMIEEHIKIISHKEASKIIETRKPEDVFLIVNEEGITAIDNSTGEAWTEDFNSMEVALRWLKGEIETEEAYKLDEEFRRRKKLPNYYITYGSCSENQPYNGGYTLIQAENRNEAIQKHNKRYGFVKNSDISRYAACYTEKEFNEGFPNKTNGGKGLQSEIK
jgi:hypothetical protein